jgi:hypothetical protein
MRGNVGTESDGRPDKECVAKIMEAGRERWSRERQRGQVED